MRFGDFLLMYSVLSLFRVFPVGVLAENLSNNLRKKPGKNFGYNIQRKLQTDNYMIIKYNQDADYSKQSFKTQYNKENKEDYGTRADYISEIIYNEKSNEDIDFTIEADKLLEINFSEAIDDLSSFFSNYYDKNCEKISYVDLSNFDSSSLQYTEYMFYECSSIQKINFENFNTESVINMKFMLYGCSQLISLALPNFNTKSVIYMDNMFNGCDQLVSIDLSKFNTESVESMGGMFANCVQLVSLDLSKFNTALVKSMGEMLIN